MAPDPSKLRKNLYMFTSIQRNCGAKVALTNNLYNWAKRGASIKASFASLRSKAAKVQWPDLTYLPPTPYNLWPPYNDSQQ